MGTIPFVLVVIGVVRARGALGFGIGDRSYSRDLSISEKEWLRREIALSDLGRETEIHVQARMVWGLYLLLTLEVLYLSLTRGALSPNRQSRGANGATQRALTPNTCARAQAKNED